MLIIIICGIHTESVDLYPYAGDDDSTLGKSDEGTSGYVYLQKSIPFYGKNYDKLVVSLNPSYNHHHSIWI